MDDKNSWFISRKQHKVTKYGAEFVSDEEIQILRTHMHMPTHMHDIPNQDYEQLKEVFRDLIQKEYNNECLATLMEVGEWNKVIGKIKFVPDDESCERPDISNQIIKESKQLRRQCRALIQKGYQNEFVTQQMGDGNGGKIWHPAGDIRFGTLQQDTTLADCEQDNSFNTGYYDNGHVSNSLPSLLIILVLLTFGMMCTTQTSAAPLHEQNDITYELLSSPYCNSKNLDLSTSCQTNYDDLKLSIDYCEFMCRQGYEPICVDTRQGGMAYICLSRNLTCEKGIRWIAWREENNLIVREEVCPNGTFQRYQSDCFHACTDEHLRLDRIPEKYIVFSVGDNVSPTFVYCNYKKGYFNVDNKPLLNYDQESMHDPFFCQNVIHFNPCDEHTEVLPNGTCVRPCPTGICRDDHDDFVCKWKCGSKDQVTAWPSVGEDSRSNVTMKSSDLGTSQQNEVDISDLPKHEDDEENKGDEKMTVIAVLLGVILLLVMIGVIVSIVRFCRKKKGSATKISKLSNRNYVKRNTIVKTDGDVHVHTGSDLSNILNPQIAEDAEASSGDETANEHIRMHLLKESDSDQQIGSEETYVKRPVNDNEETYVKKPAN